MNIWFYLTGKVHDAGRALYIHGLICVYLLKWENPFLFGTRKLCAIVQKNPKPLRAETKDPCKGRAGASRALISFSWGCSSLTVGDPCLIEFHHALFATSMSAPLGASWGAFSSVFLLFFFWGPLFFLTFISIVASSRKRPMLDQNIRTENIRDQPGFSVEWFSKLFRKINFRQRKTLPTLSQ